MSQTLPLFVYGTLMQGEGAHALLGKAKQHPAHTIGSLYHLPAGYPALSPSGDTMVHGAWLQPVSPQVLHLLDQYEGVQEGLYRRGVIKVHTPALSFDCWAWLMDDPLARGGRLIRSGKWRQTRRR